MPTSFRTTEHSDVATCATLDPNPANWTVIPYLYPISVHRQVAPAIDSVSIGFDYGLFVQREGTAGSDPLVSSNAGGVFAAKIPARQFVRVRDFDSAGTLLRTWYGRLGPHSKQPHGSSATGTATGFQTLHADGLLMELDRVQVRSSVVEQSPGSTSTVERLDRGLAFNPDSHNRARVERGNRSAIAIDGVYVFSRSPWGETKWTAQRAAEYLLRYQSPTDVNGDDICEWRLINGSAVDWYDVSMETDRRTVKQILDEMIHRGRLAGYYVEPIIDNGTFVANVQHTFVLNPFRLITVSDAFCRRPSMLGRTTCLNSSALR